MSLRSVYGRRIRHMYSKWPKYLLKKHQIDLDKKHPVYGVCWTSFPRLKRHFCKNNKSIEFKPEEQKV
jgi:hypothetical protein